ncbi:hypothetical protein SAMD00019534_053500 [Acytostelium subglobosum LB1]|uniref:hypothetical protein n=1 Tax=Acytostelium subglobosum LB1 TaxID=1410327 RepID=UPI0006449131|nr:hypothetical protein SAMD00019534_053500 [Acytostelium subglobosum LB1]GAM22175.1 hypothetical protein SAMD00019534_053500 [Acytostelium subglobosum LB1]|eukprot:XP_012755275.1 hypothetical protein SAMD00019534_053500 [Acytostelium subglobosum LB1]
MASLVDKQHNWIKKHFKHPPFCFVCTRLIWDIGKLANYCTTCHLASHIECNSLNRTQYCTIIKHDWSKDHFDNSPLCSGCNNIIFSSDKLSGFNCAKCSIKTHKNCRSLTPKCESSKKLFSMVKSPFDSSNSNSNSSSSSNSSSMTSGSNNANNNSYGNLDPFITQTTTSSIGGNSLGGSLGGSMPQAKSGLSASSTTLHSPKTTGASATMSSPPSSGLTSSGKDTTNINNNNNSNTNSPATITLSASSSLISSSSGGAALTNSAGAANGNNLASTNKSSVPNIPINIGAALVVSNGGGASSSSSPSATSPNAISQSTSTLSPKPSWTLPSIPSVLDNPAARPGTLTKSHDPMASMASGGSFSSTIKYSLTNQISSVDIFNEFETINRSVFTQNQKLLFVEKVKSFFLGLTSRMDSKYDLSASARPRSFDDLSHALPSLRFKSISHIFHYEMLAHGRFRTQEQIEQYRHTMELFLQLYACYFWGDDSEIILRIALEFYNHLCTHRTDPENVLLGMTPSKDIQRRIKKYFYISETKQQQQQHHHHHYSINSSSNNNINTSSSRFASRWDLRISRQSLIENITSWGRSIDDKDLLRQIKEFAQHLEKEKLSPSDVVVIKIPKNWSAPESGHVVIDPNHQEFDGGSFIFARYVKEADPLGLSCYVHIQPDERTTIRIPHSRVVSLAMIDFVIPQLQSGDRKLEKFITNPLDAFTTELQTAVKDTTRQYLMSQGYNVNLLSHGNMSLDQLTQLKTQITALSGTETFFLSIDQMSSQFISFFSQYLKKVYMHESKGDFQIYIASNAVSTTAGTQSGSGADDLAKHLVVEYNHTVASISSSNLHQMLSAMDLVTEDEYLTAANKAAANFTKHFAQLRQQYNKFKPYLPSLRQLISDIDNGRVLCLRAKDTLPVLVDEIDLAISRINVDYNAIYNGTKKSELMKWWLGLIGTSVDTYLQSKGFYKDVVPTNYIDTPPTSISKVKENLRIVNLVLRPSVQEDMDDRLKHLMAPLKKNIYQSLDEFLCLAQNLLFDLLKNSKHFGEESREFERPQDLDLHVVLEAIQKLPNGTGDDQTFKMASLIKDILYIREMKHLEEKYYSNEILTVSQQPLAEKQPLSDCVPITGLIFSRLLRTKHELRTVLEVFDQRVSARSPFPNVGHHGVIIGKKQDNDN